MKKLIIVYPILLCSLLTARPAYPVEISLDNFKVDGNKTSSSIGYADMEKVFESHPLTKRLQAEFNTEAEKRKKDIDAARQEITATENIVKSSSTAILQLKIELDALKTNFAAQQAMPPQPEPVMLSTEAAAPVAVSTETAKPALDQAMITQKEVEIKEKEAGIDKMKKDIEKKNIELMRLIDKSKKELGELEEKHTGAVLSDLYSILEKITIEENLSMIVDKGNILYGHSAQDYTDKVLERLRGR
ncbi:MAG: OmpH family outer membrane protein [Elusimicrobiota bacterium]